ncbi:MAG: tRNA (adenosine(37)-N6)-threonylcarbamoyltransferase complex ATPase subunit type 1 TsaE [Armatimonadetes bacterium]|nr:tRNA (adenosine(37)-N6)-threonylcarbamoyltransferase complex ATPase subunit type 1 TsaE [Armatimonadota bacterium]NIM23411.1 tRNA (adenosine(37)-N6)-threonylcarbamoyltransferase complex ATPase subunit type 1 TsaE [Armatimonadota bacterium]NIM67276.1 tRNA (adenosine(37)-N6)-threonylcarbamoyltransferase complex ATPase subunit type 1 TsaE [Armatimonadota bacterium]NIM75774.1 tRNA (adenosine(37)-N6)-threonylcarbamoyltransferase complex ATPase subunit type 1 TsaE [Armatimonadota bacterium]NIN0546
MTRRLGAAVAEALAVGDLIGLEGDLGAGKTVFTQGIAEGIGSNEPATSPSFVLIHIYTGRITLAHIDLYRLSSIQAEELGLDDYLTDAAGVVEWVERLSGLEPDLWIKFSFLSSEPERRRLEFSSLSERGETLLAAVARTVSND